MDIFSEKRLRAGISDIFCQQRRGKGKSAVNKSAAGRYQDLLLVDFANMPNWFKLVQIIIYGYAMAKALTPSQVFRLHLSLLESLYDVDFLGKHPPKHPAQIYWKMCIEILEKGGAINWNATDEYFRKLLHMASESCTLINLGKGGIEELRIGDIKIYGDVAVQKKLKSRLPNPTHYYPLMLELSFASYNISQNHKVVPLELENQPDLRIDTEELDIPIYVECKCLESISENRIYSTIRKANKQLKSVGLNSCGIIVLDISNAITQVLEDVNTDETPIEVQRVIDLAKQAISGEKNRSVSRIIIRWAKALKLEDAKQKCLFLTHYYQEIDHENVNGTQLLPKDTNLYKGETSFFRIISNDIKAGVNQIQYTETMLLCQKTFNFSKDELIDSFINCDKIQRVYLDEKYYIVLFAKRIRHKTRNAYILASGNLNENSLTFDFAFKLPPQIFSLVNLNNPLEMLLMFAEQYGLTNIVGTHQGKFIPNASIIIPRNSKVKLIEIKNPDRHKYISSNIHKTVEKNNHIEIKLKLLFSIDITALLSDLNI